MASRGTDQTRQEAYIELAQALAHALDVLARSEESGSRRTATPRADSELVSFHELANDYVGDTRRQRTAMVFLYFASLGAVSLAAGLSIWAADAAARSGRFMVPEFLGRASVVVVLLLTAVAAIWQADRHRRAAAEQLRLARQLRTLPVFIGSVEDVSLKDLLRGAMAPRFFPRALDDDDVLREPQWPDPDQVLRALGKGSADDDLDENDPDHEGGGDEPGAGGDGGGSRNLSRNVHRS